MIEVSVMGRSMISPRNSSTYRGIRRLSRCCDSRLLNIILWRSVLFSRLAFLVRLYALRCKTDASSNASYPHANQTSLSAISRVDIAVIATASEHFDEVVGSRREDVLSRLGFERCLKFLLYGFISAIDKVGLYV